MHPQPSPATVAELVRRLRPGLHRALGAGDPVDWPGRSTLDRSALGSRRPKLWHPASLRLGNRPMNRSNACEHSCYLLRGIMNRGAPASLVAQWAVSSTSNSSSNAARLAIVGA